MKSRRQTLHRRAAEALIEANEEPEAIARHFTEAGLDNLAIEWWSKAGEDALRRSAYKEAIADLGRAIAMAEKAERAATQQGAGDAGVSSRLLKLHTAYGHAAMWLNGFAATEMGAAYARASELARSADGVDARFVAYYAQSLTGFMRGQNRQARETAEAFLREAESEGRPTEAGVARRVLGFVLLKLGDLQAARSVLERALGDYINERDAETLFRFGNDTQVSATNFLALTEWHLGELEHARQLTDRSSRRAAELGHVAAIASALYFKVVLESRRDDFASTRLAVEPLLALTEEHNLKTYADVCQVFANWVRGRQVDPESGCLGSSRRSESYVGLGNKSGAPSFYGMLAELEAMTGGYDRALMQIDQGLAIADETEERFTDPYLHRLRGECLLKREPGNSAPAEEAFKPPSRSQSSKALVVTSCSPRFHSPSSTNRPAAPLKPAPFSRQPSMAFRRLRKCPKSMRLRLCSSCGRMALKGFLLAWIALGSAAHLLKCRANRPAADDNPPIPALQLPRLVNQYDSTAAHSSDGDQLVCFAELRETHNTVVIDTRSTASAPTQSFWQRCNHSGRSRHADARERHRWLSHHA